MYAVVRSGGKQYRVSPGGSVRVEKLAGEVGSKVTLDEVLMVGGEGDNRWTSGFGRTVRAAVLSPFIKQKITMFLSSERSEDLVRLVELVERGAVTPQLDRVLPLAEAATAMELLEQGHIRGKIALTTDTSLD